MALPVQVLSDQGKCEAAEEMHRQTLELCKRVLGPKHRHTFVSMSFLMQVLNAGQVRGGRGDVPAGAGAV